MTDTKGEGTEKKKVVQQDKFAGLPEEAIQEILRVQAEQAAKLMRPRATAKRIFGVQRARLLAEVSLKFYKCLLDPLASTLADELRQSVVELSVEQTELLFNFASSVEMQQRQRKELERVAEFLRESLDTYERASKTYLELVSPVSSIAVTM